MLSWKKRHIFVLVCWCFPVMISKRLWKCLLRGHMVTREDRDRRRHELLSLCLSFHQIHSRSLLYQLIFLEKMEAVLFCARSVETGLFSAPAIILGWNGGVSFHACPRLSDTVPSRSSRTAVMLSLQKNWLFTFCFLRVFIWTALRHVMVVSVWGVDLSSKW